MEQPQFIFEKLVGEAANILPQQHVDLGQLVAINGSLIPCFMLFDYDKDNNDKNIVDKSKELLALLGENTDPPETILINDNVACFPKKWEKSCLCKSEQAGPE